MRPVLRTWKVASRRCNIAVTGAQALAGVLRNWPVAASQMCAATFLRACDTHRERESTPGGRSTVGAKKNGSSAAVTGRLWFGACLKTYIVPPAHRGRGRVGEGVENLTEVLRHVLRTCFKTRM